MAKQEEELNIEVNKDITRDEAGAFITGVVHFNSVIPDGAVIPEGTVNLSRTGSNTDCEFQLHNLDQHDGHSPAWHNEVEMEEYIQRVLHHADKLVNIGEI